MASEPISHYIEMLDTVAGLGPLRSSAGLRSDVRCRGLVVHHHIYIYIYTHTYINMCMCIYIHIYYVLALHIFFFFFDPRS